MARYVTDIETNGLIGTGDRIHVLALRDMDTGEVLVFRRNHEEDTIQEGLRVVEGADLIVFHNGIRFDIPFIQSVYPSFRASFDKVRDTLVIARVCFPDLTEADMKRVKSGFPRNLINSHSLEAWGRRLKQHKGDYEGDTRIADVAERKLKKWDDWNPDMEAYCVQDLAVTHALWDKLEAENLDPRCSELEHKVAIIIARQERHGFLFDRKKAEALHVTLLAEKARVEAELLKVFRPRFLTTGLPMTPKRASKRYGYEEGAEFTPGAVTPFNPGSRDHAALWLKKIYGWKPVEFTDGGRPKIDEKVLSELPYPEAALLAEYLTLEKRIGQLADGAQAWLRSVQADGRIHGSVNTNGAVTGRMTHSRPNMAQVPASRSPWGKECRELFTVPPGKALVGCDADALELRDLAGYMAIYDGGAYIDVVLKGKKEYGTDMHSVNCRAIGFNPAADTPDGGTWRDRAKTVFYGFIYGAGDEKLGTIVTGKSGRWECRQVGADVRARLLTNLDGLGDLVDAIKRRVKERGYLVGLDGRKLPVRSEHSALNTLLQSAGAVQMKKALVLLDERLQELGLQPGINYEFVLNCHDEVQIEVDEAQAEVVGREAAEAIRRAGESFGFRCPLAGQYSIGRNWAETH